MSGSSCGCETQPCTCCEGVQVLTPASEYNRPGLSALSYRVGTHGQFLETMKARLSTMTVEGVEADGQTVQSYRPLAGLSTRDPGDFSIALLDGWASVGDVLSFYQERIANEGYLRTATERRSVLELSRLVGYTLRPGVAASVYLAYTLDDNQVDPVTIPTGARSQSVPGPGEQPQYFETSEDLLAHREWNNLQVRMHRPQDITLDNALSTPSIQVAGSNTGLKAGDKLLLLFSSDGSSAVVRSVATVNTQFAEGSSAISLQPLGPNLLPSFKALQVFLQTVKAIFNDSSGEVTNAINLAQELTQQVYLGAPTDPQNWVYYLNRKIAGGDDVTQPDVVAALNTMDSAIKAIFAPGTSGEPQATSPDRFVTPLLVGPVAQARNSLQLRRDLAAAFLATASATKRTGAADGRVAAGDARLSGNGGGTGGTQATTSVTLSDYAPRYADTGTQLLVNFAPRLQDSYYQAWAGATLNATPVPLLGLYALRSRNALFGASAARLPTYYTAADGSSPPPGTLKPQDQWVDWKYQTDEGTDNAFLDQANDAIAPGSYALAYGYGGARVMRVARAATAPRSQYGLSAQSTQLVFDVPAQMPWRQVSSNDYITTMRTVQLYAQSDALTLVDMPITDDVGGVDDNQQPVMSIELDGLYRELTSGRWLILSGERSDVAQVNGVQAAELLMVSGISHSYDPALPGDTVHTTLHLATPTAYRYKRGTATIYGNVAKATQGATCNEPLGSGDGAQALQSFTLKQPPLTFVPAPTAVGATSTLHAYVDNVEWHETDSLAWLGPADHGFVTLTDDAGNTTLVFGDGEHGARLPSGMHNVNAVYRTGMGRGGNVKANQISMLQTRPLGVKAVINPLRASGGADPESRDLARENAPLSVLALDRLVSLQDYTSFTRRFAGIAKALAQRTTDGRRELIYLTIAGVDDASIDPSSDLYANLLAALVKLGDPDLPLRVDVRELKALALSARIKLLPDYRWEPVATAVRALLLDRFGFERRALGQPALTCEVISAIQGVAGVGYVDIESFGDIPERRTITTTDHNGVLQATRSLVTQGYIASRVGLITGLNSGTDTVNGGYGGSRLLSPPGVRRRGLDGVDAFAGGYDGQLLRPAELAIFTPAVSDTLILNQIP